MANLIETKDRFQCRSFDQRMKKKWFISHKIDMPEAILLNLSTIKDSHLQNDLSYLKNKENKNTTEILTKNAKHHRYQTILC